MKMNRPAVSNKCSSKAVKVGMTVVVLCNFQRSAVLNQAIFLTDYTKAKLTAK